jgi:hypothetical protein
MQRIKFFILLFLCTSSVMAQRRNLLFDANFNDGILSEYQHRDIYNDSAQVITDSVTRYGQKSVRVEVKSNSIGIKGIRSEFSFEPETYPERWYGYSIFAPSSYLPDSEPEIVTQWHDTPDFKLGEKWISPSISLWVENGKWNLHLMWDTARVTEQEHWMGKIKQDFGNVKLNAWTDWVFHIKFSYKSDGLIEVYRNGVKIFTRVGPNGNNDEVLPYWKIGIYKWPYKDHSDGIHKYGQRVLFYSQIRKGDEKATYKDVAPSYLK